MEDADDEMSPATMVADDAQPTALEDDRRYSKRSPTADPDEDEEFPVNIYTLQDWRQPTAKSDRTLQLRQPATVCAVEKPQTTPDGTLVVVLHTHWWQSQAPPGG